VDRQRPRRPDEEPAREPAAEPAAPAGAHAGVLAMQRGVGNAAVARHLQRVLVPDGTAAPPVPAGPGPLGPAGPQPAKAETAKPAFVPQGPYGQAYVEARTARDAFVGAGKLGPVTYNPSANNKDNYYGGFDVEYDPKKSSGELKVVLKGACTFLPGIVLNAKGRAVAKEPSAQTAAAVKAINKLKKDERPAEVAKWKWSSDGGAEANDEATFKTKYADVIRGGWAGKHQFRCDRQWWEDVGATVDVQVTVTDGPKAGTDHMTVNVYKVPPGYIGGDAHVSRKGGSKGSAFDNTMQITSADVEERGDDLLRRKVDFDKDKNTLTGASKKRIEALEKDMPNAPKGATIKASDVTATVQGADDAARQARFAAICKVLVDGGMDRARIKFADGATGDGAVLVVGTGAKQTVAAHEAGHMFGLDDEYTGGDAYGAGKKTEHTDFAAKEGFTGAQHATSDAIMSGGKEVAQHHYVTFLDALRQVSGITEWAYGAPRKVEPPSELGDYPVPDPGATTGVA